MVLILKGMLSKIFRKICLEAFSISYFWSKDPHPEQQQQQSPSSKYTEENLYFSWLILFGNNRAMKCFSFGQNKRTTLSPTQISHPWCLFPCSVQPYLGDQEETLFLRAADKDMTVGSRGPFMQKTITRQLSLPLTVYPVTELKWSQMSSYLSHAVGFYFPPLQERKHYTVL